jgi:hypothetical protein
MNAQHFTRFGCLMALLASINAANVAANLLELERELRP